MSQNTDPEPTLTPAAPVVPPRMRVVILDGIGGTDQFRLVGRPVPTPGAGEVLVEVHAAGVNPVDWATRAGHGVPVPKFPAVLGWDVSGVVVALGPGVGALAVGDEVFGLLRYPDLAGCYAGYVAAPAAQLARKPEKVSHLVAGAAPMAALAVWQGLVQVAKVRAGQRVLVSGATGGIGHIAVQVAKAAGAEVIATAVSADHDFVRSFGADQVLDYTRQQIAQTVKGVDVVVDHRGGAAFAESLDVLRPGGMVLALGGREPGQEELVRSRGLRVGHVLAAPDAAALGEIAKLLGDGRLRIATEQVYLLEEVGAAHLAGERGSVRGRLVLDLG